MIHDFSRPMCHVFHIEMSFLENVRTHSEIGKKVYKAIQKSNYLDFEEKNGIAEIRFCKYW